MGPFAEPYYEYSTGRNLMIFDKDHDTAEGSQLRMASSSPGSGGSYSQAYGFATITMYSWWRSSEIKWRTKIYSSPEGGWKLVVNIAVHARTILVALENYSGWQGELS